MKKRRKLKYNDLKEIMMLDHSGFHNGVVVDDAALEVMLRIEKTMQRLMQPIRKIAEIAVARI